jgi:hypothetical protein
MMPDMLPYAVTENERSILEDIDEIGHGELYDLRHVDQLPEKLIDVSKKFVRFFRILKSIKQASKLIIHNGEPSVLEYRTTTTSGRRCLKRIKF